MTRDADWNSPDLVNQYKNPEWSDLDAIVRDVTAVGSRPKSEVRARIKAYAKKCVAGALDEALNSCDGIYNP